MLYQCTIIVLQKVCKVNQNSARLVLQARKWHEKATHSTANCKTNSGDETVTEKRQEMENSFSKTRKKSDMKKFITGMIYG